METEIEKRMREIAREEIAKEKKAAAATTASESVHVDFTKPRTEPGNNQKFDWAR